MSGLEWAWQHHSAGHRVFSLHPIITLGGNRVCSCGNPKCQAAGKHPRDYGWENTPHISEDTMSDWASFGMFDDGYGVLLRGLLVIDVDARNGGLGAYARLCERVPEVMSAAYIVETGSGGGSKHLYFSVPEGLSLLVKHPDFVGIDFKSGSHYVVGAGSEHISGKRYEAVYGTPEDVEPAPSALLELLARPTYHRASYDGREVDVSHEDIVEMLSHVGSLECDSYEPWVKVGMSIHHATGGTGFELWNEWSSQSSKHDPEICRQKWQSFGKSSNPVTLGTLVHYAKEGGWIASVAFGVDPENLPLMTFDTRPMNFGGSGLTDTTGIDLLRPPGFVGRLAAWMESNSRRKRERLAVATALAAVGNTIGLKYTDSASDGVTANLFVFCVAPSATGKESFQQALMQCHEAAGVVSAQHGAIKSEQEIVRNLIRNQAAFYVVDEIGIFLQKVSNAQKKGGASYLDGVIGMLMSAYSKSMGRMPVSGDVREDVEKAIKAEVAAIYKQMDREGETDRLVIKVQRLVSQLEGLGQGLDRPFLSLVGYTTPETFNDVVNHETAQNGFIRRSILFREYESAPPYKRGFSKTPMPFEMQMTMKQLYGAGSSAEGRIEHYGERIVIPSADGVEDLLDAIVSELDDLADHHKNTTGLEALALGAFEIVKKVALILAAPEGLRTIEHVRWAYALVKKDIEEKSRLAVANDLATPKNKALQDKIIDICTGDGEKIGTIKNRLRKYQAKDVDQALDDLVKSGLLSKVERIKPSNKTAYSVYCAV